MVLESVSIFPHGTMILDINSSFMLENLPSEAINLHHAASNLAQSLFAASTTDYIFLITPHGISLSEKIGIYQNSSYLGTAEWNHHWTNFRLSYENESSLCKELQNHLQARQVPVNSITCFSQGVPAPLAWGEVVPLWFCGECHRRRPTVIILTLPTSRHTDPMAFSEVALLLGEHLAEYAIISPHKIAVVVSADLSHVHAIEGQVHELFRSPDPSLVPNPVIAKQFDDLIVEWAKIIFESCDVSLGEEKLRSVLTIASEAKSCGIGGCCVVQGIFRKIVISSKDLGWKGKFHHYAAPTYYGMMVVGGTIDRVT